MNRLLKQQNLKKLKSQGVKGEFIGRTAQRNDDYAVFLLRSIGVADAGTIILICLLCEAIGNIEVLCERLKNVGAALDRCRFLKS